VVAAIAGLLVAAASFRVQALYLAIVSFGFVLVVNTIILNIPDLTGGAVGLTGMPPLADTQLATYYFVAVALGITIASTLFLLRSPLGRALMAARDNRLAASASGVPTRRVKMIAFVWSSVLAGLAGALYAHVIGFVGTDEFQLLLSVQALVMVLIGGIGTVWGGVVGAFLLQYVITIALASYVRIHLLIYGALLFISMVVIPQGIIGLAGWIAGATIKPLKRAPSKVMTPRPHVVVKNTPLDPAPVAGSKNGGLQPLLEISGVSKRFGGVVALDGVSMQISAGLSYGLIGPNGSGKTTLLNTISAFYTPDSGRIVFDGQDITRSRPEGIARRGIGRTFQNLGLFSSMSVLENVLLGAENGARTATDRQKPNGGRPGNLDYSRYLLDRLELGAYAKDRPELLPYGIQKKVELARALAGRPRLLLLDEPAAGLNDAEAEELFPLLAEVRSEDLTLIVVDHNIEFIAALVKTVIVLDKGTVISQGTPDEVRSDSRVLDAYFGVEA
jgi:branched-chain amino acid transport system permease protein